MKVALRKETFCGESWTNAFLRVDSADDYKNTLFQQFQVSPLPFVSRLLWRDKLLSLPHLKLIQKQHSFFGAFKSHPHWTMTCPCMPMTLEGGSTISQLRRLRSHAPAKATPRSMSAKRRDNQFSIYSTSLRTRDDVWMRLQFVLGEHSSDPNESLNCPADCPVEGKQSSE